MRILTILAWLVLLPAPILAAGDGHHHEGDEHMAGMMAVKDTIPEEYRIMDRTPVTPTSASLKRGAELFRTNCTVCHGEKGRGDGPAAAGMKNKPANFHDQAHSRIYSPGEKYWIIGHGTKQTGMPAFGERLAPLQRWDLVNFIVQLPKEGTDDLFN